MNKNFGLMRKEMESEDNVMLSEVIKTALLNNSPTSNNYLTPEQVENSKIINFIKQLNNTGQRFGMDGFTKSFEVSPDEAKYLLWKYDWKYNRPLSKPTVSMYKARMAEGGFIITGQSLIIGRIAEENNSPVILDGRHRLTAVAEGDTTIRLLFFFHDPFSLDKNLLIFKKLDRGTSRSLVHVLKSADIPDRDTVKNILKPILQYCQGTKGSKHFVGSKLHGHIMDSLTDDQFERYYFQNAKKIDECVTIVKRLKKQGFQGAAIVGSVYYEHKYLLEKPTPNLEKFIEGIIIGSDLKEDSVELVFRDFLKLFKNRGGYVFTRLDVIKRNIGTNMAFNHFRTKPDKPFKKFTTKRMDKFLVSVGMEKMFTDIPNIRY